MKSFFLSIFIAFIYSSAMSEELTQKNIKLICKGKTGFIDQIYVDLNNDGKFDVNEQLMGPTPTDEKYRRIIFDLSHQLDSDNNPIVMRSISKINSVSKSGNKIILKGQITYAGESAKGTYSVELQLKELDTFKWKNPYQKKRKIPSKIITIISSYKMKWENLPKGAKLVRSGLALNLNLDPKKQLVITGTRGGATTHSGPGYPSGPVMGGTWVNGPTGGTLARYSMWFQKSATESYSKVYCFGSGKSSAIGASFKSQKWIDLCDEEKGLAFVVQNMKAVSPKAFGTMPSYANKEEHNFYSAMISPKGKLDRGFFRRKVRSVAKRDNILYMWFWPEFTKGLALKNATEYTLNNIALVPHKGRSIKWKHLKHTEKKLHLMQIVRGTKDPYGVGYTFDNLMIPDVEGNLKEETATNKIISLAKPDLKWVSKKLPIQTITKKPQGNKIPIEITNYYKRKAPSGLNLPYRVGSSLPKGLIKSVKQLNIVSNKHTAIPFQIKPTAYWPDNSLKWVLIDFILTPEEATASPAVWLLHSTKEINQQHKFKNVLSKKVGDEIEVDTGKIKATITKKSGLFETVHIDLNNNNSYEATEEIISKRSSQERRAFLDYVHAQNLSEWLSSSLLTKGKTGKSQIVVKNLTIDDNGPVRCTIKVEGTYMTPGFHKIRIPLDEGRGVLPKEFDGKEWMPTAAKEGSGFTIYLTFYKNLPYVKVWHHFIFEGISGYQHLKRLGISSKINIDASKKSISFETSKGVHTETNTDGLTMTQQDFNLAKVTAFSNTKKTSNLIAKGQKGSDWMDVSDNKWGVAVGLKDMYEKNPQGISIDENQLTVNFWDPANGAWDSRSPYGYAYPFTGISRSHETIWVFHSKNEPAANIKHMIEHVTKPEFAVVSPEWTCSTRAFGLISAIDMTIPAEQVMIERVLENFESTDGPYQKSKRSLLGMSRYGTFSSTEGYLNYGLAILSLRSGSHRIIRASMAKSRSDAELSYRKGKTREASKSARRNANHPKDITTSYRRTLSSYGVRGLNLMYYMTGDEGLKDFSAYMTAQDWKEKGGIGTNRTGNGLLLWAWEQRYSKADFESKIEAGLPKLLKFSKNKTFGFASFEMYGGVNSIIELYFHTDKHKKSLAEILNNRATSLSEGVIASLNNSGGLKAKLPPLKKERDLKKKVYTTNKTEENKKAYHKAAKNYESARKKLGRVAGFATQSIRHMSATSFTRWKEGKFKSKEISDMFQRYLKSPSTGGAFGHHLYSECHMIPIALEAIKKGK